MDRPGMSQVMRDDAVGVRLDRNVGHDLQLQEDRIRRAR